MQQLDVISLVNEIEKTIGKRKNTHTGHAQLDLKTRTKRMEVVIMITRKPNAIQN